MMKKIQVAGFALVGIALLLGVLTGRVYARISGSYVNTDAACFGAKNFEVCVDVSGNLLPTSTTNSQTLGTSGLPWTTAFITTLTNGGNATVGGNLSVTGTTTLSSTVTASAPIGLFIGTGAQIAALAPSTTGQIMYNSDRKTVCVSTGVLAGAWVFMSTSTTTGAVCN